MNWMFKIALGIVLFYLIVAAVLFFTQRRMMFGPDRTRVLPSSVNVKNVSEVELITPEGHVLYCWYGTAAANKPTILFFHGNGGNVANREDKYRQLMEQGYGIFMLGYRGFGGSGGSPSEVAFVKDARLAYDHLTKKNGLDASDIVIYGESIGTSVAVQLAATVPSHAVVLEAPMFSVLSIAQGLYPYVPVGSFLRDKFETNLFIGKVTAPLLIVHGDEDRVIPISSGRALYELANEPKRFQVISGGGHNDLYSLPIVAVISEFLGDLKN